MTKVAIRSCNVLGLSVLICECRAVFTYACTQKRDVKAIGSNYPPTKACTSMNMLGRKVDGGVVAGVSMSLWSPKYEVCFLYFLNFAMAYPLLNFIKPKQHSNKGTVSEQLSVCKKFYSELIKIAFLGTKETRIKLAWLWACFG